ncbi:MAG: peptide ABC transporter substrate-binding protein [Bdellovibrionaceae bacterium]|nr:peptide ABC transporter substrate-binding protein [Pseudobdellovibrionaceae bacterium]
MQIKNISILIFCIGIGVSALAAKNRQGQLRMALNEDPEILNPLLSASDYAVDVQTWVCDSLLKRDLDTYSWQSAIAEKWELAKDNGSITFHLRDNVFFHNGAKLTADDVKFSFDVYKKPGVVSPSVTSYFDGIDSVEILSPLKVKVKFKNSYFKNFEVIATNWILPKAVYDVKTQLPNQLVCAGPYQLDAYEKSKKISLKLFDKYFGFNVSHLKNLNTFQSIEFQLIREEEARVEKLKKSEIDFLEFPNSDLLERKLSGDVVQKSLVKVKVENKIPKTWSYIGWNLAKPLFSDPELRKALNLLVNKEDINKVFFDNQLYVLNGPFLHTQEYGAKIKPFVRDVKKARTLLKKAGWGDSNKDGILDKMIDGVRLDLKFTLSYANKDFEKVWQYIREDYRSSGIDMELKFQDFNVMMKAKEDLSFDALALSWSGGGVDPDPKQLWHSESSLKGGSNFVGYKNIEVNKQIDIGRMIMDRKKRIAVFEKVYQMVADENPYLFLFMDKFNYYAHVNRFTKPKDTFNYGIGLNTWSVKK